jgi:hypothetical protein
MGFVQRAFTPPGTGGREAAEIQAQAAAMRPAPIAPPPTAPTAPAPPAAPPQFMAGQAPGARQRSQITATTMLGAAAAGGQQARKTMLGQ